MKHLLYLLGAMLLLVGCSDGEGRDEPIDMGVGAVVINEVNTSAKYIELYNPTDYDFNLSGVRIRKNNDSFLLNADKSADFVVPDGTTLPGGGFAPHGCPLWNQGYRQSQEFPVQIHRCACQVQRHKPSYRYPCST